jgi:hypothetical protein
MSYSLILFIFLFVCLATILGWYVYSDNFEDDFDSWRDVRRSLDKDKDNNHPQQQ